jgi:hypothetical protein
VEKKVFVSTDCSSKKNIIYCTRRGYWFWSR